MGTPEPTNTASATATAATLFGCLFAAQSGLLVLTPILSPVAEDLGVSATAAGLLRAVSGATAAAVAVGLVAARRTPRLRDLLVVGLALLAGSALGSAVAPNFAVLAVLQVTLGAGVAIVLAAGLAAAARWAPPGRRARVLSWALVGQPTAWVVGMPVVGALGQQSWRLAWLVPLTASLLALAATIRRERGAPEPPAAPLRDLVRRPGAARWAVGELLAYGGWAGVLVFCGSLLTEAHGASVAAAGMALGAGASGFVVGTLLARRWVDRAARSLLLWVGPTLAIATLVFGAVRPSFGFSVAAFTVVALLSGARVIAGSAVGLDLAGVGPLPAMSLRASSVQLGYLAGSVLGGIGLGLAGWAGLGAVLAALTAFAVATTPPRQPRRSPEPQTAAGAPAPALTEAGVR